MCSPRPENICHRTSLDSDTRRCCRAQQPSPAAAFHCACACVCEGQKDRQSSPPPVFSHLARLLALGHKRPPGDHFRRGQGEGLRGSPRGTEEHRTSHQSLFLRHLSTAIADRLLHVPCSSQYRTVAMWKIQVKISTRAFRALHQFHHTYAIIRCSRHAAY